MKKEKKNVDKFSIKEVIILIVITAVVSLAAGFVVTSRLYKDKNSDNENISVNNDNLETFIKNYNYIIDNYYGEYDEKELIDAALAGVLETLGDPYTTYIDENSVDNFNIQLEGNYDGLGIEIYNNEKEIIISNVFSNSPADKAGLKIGDKIIKLNDQEVSGLKAKEFSSLIKNNNKNSFELTIIRNEETIKINVEKSNVTINSVEAKTFNKDGVNIGYLSISIFANNTFSQFKNELEKLEGSNIDSLIIDVRNNTGGHLTSVENILSLFLDSTHVIYKMEDSSGIKKYHSTGTIDKKYPIVILTNEISASASEILSAALKEEYGAFTVGKKTYGKGSAQELITLPDGTQYKFTTRKWLTPSGNSIDGIGVDVDKEVELSNEYINNPNEETDNQLQAAISTLLER